jgi:predicted nuclease of restriction endonuclease-like (RecB) superfamily
MSAKSKTTKAKITRTVSASRIRNPAKSEKRPTPAGYSTVHVGIVDLLQAARAQAVRSINVLMTASYWEIGRRIIEAEQQGRRRAGYGEQLLKHLSLDLTHQFGRGFGVVNLQQMRNFYLTWPAETIYQTPSDKSSTKEMRQTLPGELQVPIASAISVRPYSAPARLAEIASHFPLPWSAYVRLLSVKSNQARRFYETEALRGGWSVRQLHRQVNSQFYERTALSRNKVALLTKGMAAKPEDAATPDEAVKDPYVLEFLNLKDEYSEADLEEALIHRLEDFLLELGDDFAFIGRQRRLRLDDTWFRVDLVFFHRRLRCMVIVDLKVGKFNYADAGQMHLYLNYAKTNWMREGENPPVGLILCSQKGSAEAHYALEGLSNKVLAAEYQTVLPSEAVIANEIAHATRLLEGRNASKSVRSKKATKGDKRRA